MGQGNGERALRKGRDLHNVSSIHRISRDKRKRKLPLSQLLAQLLAQLIEGLSAVRTGAVMADGSQQSAPVDNVGCRRCLASKLSRTRERVIGGDVL